MLGVSKSLSSLAFIPLCSFYPQLNAVIDLDMMDILYANHIFKRPANRMIAVFNAGHWFSSTKVSKS